LFQEGGTDTLNLNQFVDVTKETVLLAVIDDRFRLGRPDSGQGFQQPCFGAIDIDFLGSSHGTRGLRDINHQVVRFAV
jgi:hypothetical protein